MMSDAKFTPGPWSAKDWRICRNVVGDATGFRFICDTATNKESRNDENAANAKLIAAAPDLLAACQEIKTTLTSPSRLLSDVTRRELQPWLPMIAAAIAKATT
jgi:hypothetical protein